MYPNVLLDLTQPSSKALPALPALTQGPVYVLMQRRDGLRGQGVMGVMGVMGLMALLVCACRGVMGLMALLVCALAGA